MSSNKGKSPEADVQPKVVKSFKFKLIVCVILIIVLIFVAIVSYKVASFLSPQRDMNVTNLSPWVYLLSTLGIYHFKSPVVNTTLGDVQGIISGSRHGRQVYEFRGIPFAKPPVDELRFEAPLPATPWEGLFKADTFSDMCLQFDAMVRGTVLGKEDCLYLNVFSVNEKPETLQPVMAYIHGGGFTGGESAAFSPKYFMDNDVVVVTFNYRLASLGFLNTGDELIRGNMGLKDQSLALRWIKENIKNFGGDPENITLFGESAGGASVHYHIISPMSRGLFHRAIMQSGNLACPWALTKNPQRQALRFGKQLNCSVDNTTVLVACLKKMNGKDIVKQHSIILSPIHLQNDFFPGSIEAVKREDTFLSENPFDMLERGDFAYIPVILGMNSAEGGLKTARLEAYPRILNELNIREKWNEHVPVLLHYNPNRTDVSDKIREYYFPGINNSSGKEVKPGDDLDTLTRMVSDAVFFEPIHKVAKYHSKFAPTYLYYYNYTSSILPSMYSLIRAAKPKKWYPWEVNVAYNYAKSVATDYADKFIWSSKDPRRFGACHAEDLLQVWSLASVADIRPSYSDYPFSNMIVNSFTSFAKADPNLQFGNVTWPDITPGNKTHLYMKLDLDPEVIQEPFKDGVTFIQSLNIRDPHEPENW